MKQALQHLLPRLAAPLRPVAVAMAPPVADGSGCPERLGHGDGDRRDHGATDQRHPDSVAGHGVADALQRQRPLPHSRYSRWRLHGSDHPRRLCHVVAGGHHRRRRCHGARIRADGFGRRPRRTHRDGHGRRGRAPQARRVRVFAERGGSAGADAPEIVQRSPGGPDSRRPFRGLRRRRRCVQASDGPGQRLVFAEPAARHLHRRDSRGQPGIRVGQRRRRHGLLDHLLRVQRRARERIACPISTPTRSTASKS